MPSVDLHRKARVVYDNDERRLLKVTKTKNEGWKILIDELNPEDKRDKRECIRFGEAPEEFLQALKALIPFYIEICEFPDNYGGSSDEDGLIVNSVTIAYNKLNLKKMSMSVSKRLKTGRLLTVTSPPTMEPPLDSSGEEYTWLNEKCVEALEDLRIEALSLVDGTHEMILREEQHQEEKE